MKLSVITINLNNEKGLRQTLESIACQTFPDYELIVIDGGSTDGSIDIIKNYTHKISYWISEPDNGIYHAMNKGIRQSKGDYLYFLNSGDKLASDTVLNEVFSSTINSPFICGNFITESKGIFKQEYPYKNRDWSFALYDIYSGDLCHQAFFINKNMFNQYGLYDERLKISADWKLFFVAIGINHQEVIYKDIDVVIYNMDGLSSTIGGKFIHEERKSIVFEELPYSTASKLERLYTLEQNSYISDIILSRKWIFFIFRAFCKIGRISGFVKS